MRLWLCQWLGLGTYLFVKVPRPGDSEGDLFGLRVKLPPVISALRKDPTKAILPDYNRLTSLLTGVRFRLFGFSFSQYWLQVIQKIHQRSHCFTVFFFILRLDLTIGLIYVIAQQIQKVRACIVAWRKVLPIEKSLVTSFWSIIQISRQPRRIRKNREHQKFLLMQGYPSKVILQFS